jgi:hypothetical protein
LFDRSHGYCFFDNSSAFFKPLSIFFGKWSQNGVKKIKNTFFQIFLPFSAIGVMGILHFAAQFHRIEVDGSTVRGQDEFPGAFGVIVQ